MKTLKILFAAIIFVGFATAVNAQEITAHAQVIDEIAFESNEEQNLNFGVLRVGQTKSISLDADGTVTAGLDAADQIVGILPGITAFTVAPNANITIEFEAEGAITSSLAAEYRVFWNYDDGTPGSNMFVDFATTGNTSFATRDEAFNSIFVYIDGKINATGATPGAYEDNLTITAVYN